MPVNLDFRDLFAALNGAEAEYLLVGGYALAVHAVPRFTKDLDLWVLPAPDNARRVWTALREFGAPLGELEEADLSSPGIVFQIGIPPNRIDILTAIDGVEFAAAWPGRLEEGPEGSRPSPFHKGAPLAWHGRGSVLRQHGNPHLSGG